MMGRKRGRDGGVESRKLVRIHFLNFGTLPLQHNLSVCFLFFFSYPCIFLLFTSFDLIKTNLPRALNYRALAFLSQRPLSALYATQGRLECVYVGYCMGVCG